MNEVFYADLFFLLNTALDGLCLFTLSRILPQPITFFRLLFSALLGGAYSVFYVLLAPGWPVTLLSFFAASLLCCRIAFVPRSLASFVRTVLFFYLTLALCGGLLVSMQSLVGIAVNAQKIGPGTVCLALIASGLLIFYCICLQRRFERKICTLSLKIRDCHLDCCALIDSGNLLFHPVHACPVALLSSDAAKLFLSVQQVPELSGESTPDPRESIRIQTPAGSRYLYGFMVEECTLFEKRKRKIPPFFLACDPSSATYSGCDLLIPPTLLETVK